MRKVCHYLEGKKYLEILKKSPSILKLSLEEIVEREAYLKTDEINEPMVVGESFHPVFGLSRKNFAEKKKKLEEKYMKNRW